MFDLSPEKILVIGILALIVLGPNRLPQAARTLGRLIAQARSLSASLQSEVRDALQEPGEAIGSAIAEFRPGQVRSSVRRAVTDTLVGAPSSSASPATAPGPYGAEGSYPPVSGLPATPGPAWPYTPDDPGLN